MAQMYGWLRDDIESGLAVIEPYGPSRTGSKEYKKLFDKNEAFVEKDADGILVSALMPDGTTREYYLTPFDRNTLLLSGDLEVPQEANNMLGMGNEWRLFKAIYPSLINYSSLYMEDPKVYA
jgi:hypothetical protein